MQRRVGVLFLLLVAGIVAAEEPLVGEPAPEISVEPWLAAPDGHALAALRGRVVVLLVGGAADLTNERNVLHWNDLRAAYFEQGLRVVALQAAAPAALPPTVEFSVGVAPGAGYTEAGTGRVALIAADGTLASIGAPAELSEVLTLKLLKKARRFPCARVGPVAEPVAAAFKKGKLAEARSLAEPLDDDEVRGLTDRIALLLAYWRGQVQRSTRAGNPAEAALYLKWIAKHFSGATEGTEAAQELKQLKRDKAAAKAIKAATTYVRLRRERVKTKGKRRRIDALVKKAKRFVKGNPGTRGAERAARMVRELETDPAVAAVRAFIAKERIDATGSGWRTRLPRPPELTFTDGRRYLWELETSEGPIRVRLFPDSAPMHVSSVIYLTELHFFDGLSFHRVIPGFMAQGGCPLGNGSGNAGYMLDSEFDPDRSHDRPGLLSAANAGPGTESSQFFLTFAPARHLDGKHTIYGEVVEGMPALHKIEALGTEAGPTKQKIVIERAVLRVE